MENGINIDKSHLAQFGENTARRLSPTGSMSTLRITGEITSSLRRLKKLENSIIEPSAGSFAQWLCDNWYLARREGLYAANAFKCAKRVISTKDSALITRAAKALLYACDGEINADAICNYLNGFQSALPLKRRELYLFIPALKAAIIGALDSHEGKEISGEIAARLFTSLRFLGDTDLSELMESLDLTERALMRDPTGVYPKMSQATRESYRRQIEKLAARSNLPEHLYAKRLMRNCAAREDDRRHIGFALFKKPHKNRGLYYIWANVLITLSLCIFAGFMTNLLTALLLLLPLSAAIKTVIDTVLLRTLPTRHVPRLELKDGIPDEGKTLCVISALITDARSGKALAARLEEFRLSSRDAGKNLLFGILADLPESAERSIEGSREWLAQTEIEINALNKKYSGGFMLLTRTRVLHEGKYMGHERKRGAILELCRLIAGSDSKIRCRSGDLDELEGAKYIITLDSDTRLTAGSARELVGAMLHPLNRPVISEKRNVVISGHGILQPRMSTSLRSAIKTPFSRLFAGQGGTDPYSTGIGELYMDLSGSSVFSGKGIIDAAAFLRCADRFPENRVLSHDALEGACLRCGNIGDIELTDSFPSGVLGFYKRSHRWIRGDWQNLPWIFSAGRDFTELDRWRLFDSLRRSLVAPAIMLSLLYSFVSGKPIAAGIATLCLLSNLIISAVQSVLRRQEQGERYRSTIISGVSGTLCQSMVSLVFLPYEAYVNFSAAVTALVRMFITKRKLLEWVPAAQTEGGSGLISHYKAFLPAVLIGLFCVVFSESVLGIASGVVWLFSPALAHSLSRGIRQKHRHLSAEDSRYLMARTREMWTYFEDFLTEEDHYLPPDNWQARPPLGLARRTSPTNIGLCLVSVLTAADLGIIFPEKAAELIDKMLATIESLPKWKGHLFNWYNTANCEVLLPHYVSTVDSGNLCASLMALSSGLREYGFQELAQRADALADAMSFAPLYNKERQLLLIGINTDSKAENSPCYDLLAGEARLTAFLAVSRGDVPKKVWERMGRSLVAKGRRRGIASWTGTMFEYLMPELFLPVNYASLMYETQSFCLYAQKTRKNGVPWGISESAYSALDPSLSYRYKAHGCQALALKPAMDEELVVSPYSSFLALAIEPENAVTNLRRIEKYEGAIGKYGFWDAFDFTSGRCKSETEPELVRCVMAHHIGMSIIAASNSMRDGIWQKRFMSRAYLRAHDELLEERIPIGAPLLRRFESKRNISEKPPRERSLWALEGAANEGSILKAAVQTNSTYNVMSTNAGVSISKCGDIIMFAPPISRFDESKGINFYAKIDGETHSLLPEKDGEYGFSHSQRLTRILSHKNGLSSEIKTEVCGDCSGEVRIISLSSAAEAEKEISIIISMKPALAFENDYVNHPAFYGLGLHAKKIEGGYLIRRLRRNRLDECYLCIKSDFDFTADFSENSMSLRPNANPQSEGWLLRPHMRIDANVTLSAEKLTQLRLTFGFGGTAEKAIDCADKALALTEIDAAALPELASALLKISTDEVEKAMQLLPHIIYPQAENAGIIKHSRGRQGLWSFGISGDYPIILLPFEAAEDKTVLESVIRRCAYLQSCSVQVELAIIVNDDGDYYRKSFGKVLEILTKLGLEANLGARGGIHVVDGGKDLSALQAAANITLDANGEICSEPLKIVNNNKIMSTNFDATSSSTPPVYNQLDGIGFEYYVNNSLPPRAWTNMLTNGRFGYLASDCGSGFMWMDNAREFTITPWLNDPSRTIGAETLIAEVDGKFYSLFSGKDTGVRVSYYPGAAIWESMLPCGRVRMTAFVPRETNARIIIIEAESDFILHWNCPLILCGNPVEKPYVVSDYVNHIFSARNIWSEGAAEFHALASVPADGFTCDEAAAVTHDYNSKCGSGLSPCFAAKFKVSGRFVLACGCDETEKLRAVAEPISADLAFLETQAYWRASSSRLRIKTPYPELDQAISLWLPYQVLACRVLGRTSIYQSGGAIGFRDQLQDIVALIQTEPKLCREHILVSCAHQYEEGDVMHWWHPSPDGDKGVRTRCSDDLLWLPWAVCEYVEKTADRSILDEKAPYLRSSPLSEGDSDRYEQAEVSERLGTVLEHCCAALDMIIKRGVGAHGILKMGSSDWNDGFDKVGGESVWLTWFFAHTARRFAAVSGIDSYRKNANEAAAAANGTWESDRWLRGYFENGDPLGSHTGDCCQIDSIAQSFAAFCDDTPKDRLDTALGAVLQKLCSDKVFRLFTPPFEDHSPNPGYIQSYGPGFRENGGQYTHASIWLALACLENGREAEGLSLLLDMLPEKHDTLKYAGEPFVIAADVSATPDHFGAAGWTWYTGSAGWYLRVVTENLLGIKPVSGRLQIKPANFAGLCEYSFIWTASDGSKYDVSVNHGEIRVNGEPYDGKGLPM